MSDTFGNEYLSRTYRKNISRSPQSQGVPQPPLELPYPPDARRIDLPKAEGLDIPAVDLRAAMENRVSYRKYEDKPLSIDELAFLLWVTQGVKAVNNGSFTQRTVPSAGARHAFETYLSINRVEGIQPGLYRYLAVEHALIEVDLAPDVNQKITHACLEQGQVLHSAVTFIWAAVLERMFWRYVERGYRYLFLDAGHVCQNLYLAAEALGCGACAIAAYDDELLNQAVGADGKDLFVVYAASLGKRA